MANLIQPPPEPSRSDRHRFPGRPDQVAHARAFVLEAAGDCPQLGNAVLLTSELCANAVQHSASGKGGTFEVVIVHGAGSLRIEVRDDGSLLRPRVQDLDSRAEDRRGLAIIAAIAHSWGEIHCVYFELRCDLATSQSMEGISQ